jgi:hypothetical protein
LLESVQSCAKKNQYRYRRWTNRDLTQRNFPRTWHSIQEALRAAQETGQNRWAQVADLVRLEVVHKFGGVYLDSNFQVTDRLFSVVNQFNGSFLGANEEQCGLDCGFLSNSFFAAPRHSAILARLLTFRSLDRINFADPWINTTTGPYYLRSGIRSSDRVYLLPTSSVYPFPMLGSERPPVPDPLIATHRVANSLKVNDGCYLLKAPLATKMNVLAAYHPLGGSWLPDQTQRSTTRVQRSGKSRFSIG